MHKGNLIFLLLFGVRFLTTAVLGLSTETLSNGVETAKAVQLQRRDQENCFVWSESNGEAAHHGNCEDTRSLDQSEIGPSDSGIYIGPDSRVHKPLPSAEVYLPKARLLDFSSVATPATSGVTSFVTPQKVQKSVSASTEGMIDSRSALSTSSALQTASPTTSSPQSTTSGMDNAARADTTVDTFAGNTTTNPEVVQSQTSTSNLLLTALSSHPVIAGQTLTPGGPGITASGTYYSMAALPSTSPTSTTSSDASNEKISIAPVATLQIGGSSANSSSTTPASVMSGDANTDQQAQITTAASSDQQSQPSIASTTSALPLANYLGALGQNGSTPAFANPILPSTPSISSPLDYALTIATNGSIGEHPATFTSPPLNTTLASISISIPALTITTTYPTAGGATGYPLPNAYPTAGFPVPSTPPYSFRNSSAGYNGTVYNGTSIPPITPYLGSAQRGSALGEMWWAWAVWLPLIILRC